MRIVIVGGVAAGVSTATRLKRLMASSADVVLFERGERISFANCALPYYVGDEVERTSLFATSAAALRRIQGVDVRERHEVLFIDREKKCVTVKNLATFEVFTEPYDVLVLATGAEPRMLPVEGFKENAFPLWRPEDADRLRAAVDAKPDLTVGIVGGGAVGLETAENIIRRGGTVHLFEYGRTIMGRNDPALSDFFRRAATRGEPRFVWHMETSVAKAEKRPDGLLELTLSTGETLTVDYLVSAAGVAPRSSLAREAGLTLGPRDTILTDGLMRTSDPSIYAVGDVATSTDPVTGEERPMMLAGTAVKEAREAADAIAGLDPKPLPGGFGTNAVSLFGLLWASTGKNEQTLLNEGLKPRKDFYRATIETASHVAWYPGAKPLLLKILFDTKGKLLGAQAIGRDGADKRIDVLSTAMRFGATVHDLAQLDLCYAPQTGSPKDPVNVVGHIGENIMQDLARFIEPHELADLMEGKAPYLGEDVPNTPENVTILDVREAAEVEDDRLDYPLVHIPLGELRDRTDEIPEGKTVVVVCRRGVRAHTASRILQGEGFENVYILTGGMQYWRRTRG